MADRFDKYLRLGFHYHVPARQVGEKIILPGYLGRFIDSLADEFRQVVCFLHSPVDSELATLDYSLTHKNISLVDIGRHESIPRRMAQSGKIRKILWANRSDIDVMLVRAPTPLIGLVNRALKGKPLAVLIVGDYVAGLDSLPQPWWRKQIIAAWSHWNKGEQMQAARRGLVFVNSHVLFRELAPQIRSLIELRTTNLTEADFYNREDTCTKQPYQLLYSGRLDSSKGLLDIVDAVRILIDIGEDVELNLVGWAYKGDHILEEIMQKAQALGVQKRIIYHGYRAIGEDLFAFYKMSDIFVTASRAAEGFPRTIWEAMAHSLPVVATRVGSIPDFIEGYAVLAEPRNPNDLADKIHSLIVNHELRRKMIFSGREISRQNTLEYRTKDLGKEIQERLFKG